MIDIAFPSLISVLAGAIVGGLGSLASAVYTQRYQDRLQRVAREANKRESVYGEFILNASKLLLRAHVNEGFTLNGDEQHLIALVNRMRLFAPINVIEAAEEVIRHIVEISFQPSLDLRKLTIADLSEYRDSDLLLHFSLECRADLDEVNRVLDRKTAAPARARGKPVSKSESRRLVATWFPEDMRKGNHKGGLQSGADAATNETLAGPIEMSDRAPNAAKGGRALSGFENVVAVDVRQSCSRAGDEAVQSERSRSLLVADEEQRSRPAAEGVGSAVASGGPDARIIEFPAPRSRPGSTLPSIAEAEPTHIPTSSSNEIEGRRP